ncbi:MAG: HAD family phosphatase [Candidatus Saccharimonadales bacterium]
MKQFAVFDIDGTLIRWQLYHAVVDKLAKQGHLGGDAHDKLHDARMVWKERTDDDAFARYETLLVETFESALPSLDPAVFDTLVDTVIGEYKNQVYTYTRDLVASLKQQGYFLLAISGSHHELVAKLAAYYGFDDFVGTHYTRNGHQFSGDVYIPSLDKQSALQTLIKKHNLSTTGSIAVGDTKSDIALLESVEKPIAFNPEKQLYTHARAHGWPIVVERKNVIYTLGSHDTQYVLD